MTHADQATHVLGTGRDGATGTHPRNPSGRGDLGDAADSVSDDLYALEPEAVTQVTYGRLPF